MDPTTIDPQVKNLVSAIGQQETGPASLDAYTKKGASGEYGRYQFEPDTWKSWAGQFLGDPNAAMSVENQNKVAYQRVASWKQQGYTPAQIAAAWNAGEESLKNDAWKTDVGTNSDGVAYNTPEYVKDVSKYYMQLAKNTPDAGASDMQPIKPVLPAASASTSNPVSEAVANPDKAIGGAVSTAMKVAGSVLPAAASAVQGATEKAPEELANFDIGLGRGALKTLENTGSMIESGLDETLGRVGNIVTGKGNKATTTGAQVTATANSPALQDKNAAQEVGDITSMGAQFVAPETAGEDIPGAISTATKALPKAAQFVAKTAGSLAQNTAIGTAQTGNLKTGAEQGVLGEVTQGAADVAGDLTGKLLNSIPKSQAVAKATQYMRKAFGSTGKKSAGAFIADDAKKLSGLETLYEQGKGLTVKGLDGVEKEFDPKTADFYENVQALNQAKKRVWNKVVSSLDKGSSMKPNLSAAKDFLQSVNHEAGNADNAIAHAQKRLSEIASKKTPAQLQKYLTDINSELGATFKGTSESLTSKIDAEMVGHLNNSLDNAVEQMKGAAVKPWRDRYSALKSIEGDMVRKSQAIMRKTGGGIPGYLDEFGNLDLVEAAFAHNPAYAVKGAGMKVISALNKAAKDPERALRNSYKMIEKYGGREAPPTEAPTLALPAGDRNGPRSTVNSGPTISLPAKLQSVVDEASQKAGVDGKKVADFFASIRQKEEATMLPAGKTQTPQTTIPLRNKSESSMEKLSQDSAVVKKQIREAIEMAKKDAQRMLRKPGENPIITPPPAGS